MRRFPVTAWRCLLIGLVYLLLGVPFVGLVIPGAGGEAAQIPMLFQSLLRNAAYVQGYFPDNVYYEDWQVFVSAYAMNCLFLSLFWVLLWNWVYAPSGLGRHKENTARLAFWVFLLLHIGSQLAYAFYVFTLGPHIWRWIITQPTGLNALLLLPQALILPFFVSIRVLCPYRIHHVFPLFAPVRARLGLRIYSKRGPR